jgi:Helix-turn-helix domain
MAMRRVVYVRDYCQDIPPTPRLVLYALASRAGDDWQYQCSQAQLARDTGLSVRTVRRAVEDLVAARYLTVVPELRKRGRPTEAFTYRFVSGLENGQNVLLETDTVSVLFNGKTDKSATKTDTVSALKGNKG